jgi:hypothetical protein
MELERILARLAEGIVEHGTRTEAGALEALSDAARDACPGAAAALVDWQGTEIARMRAFGIVHGVVLDLLDPGDHAWIADRMLGRGDLALVG